MPTQEPIGYLLGPMSRPLPIGKGDVLTLGRERQNTILLEDILASRQHAALECTAEGELYVKDLGSKNGTRLNGKALTPKERARVKGGDTIRIGGKLIFFASNDPGMEPKSFKARTTQRMEEMDTDTAGPSVEDVQAAVAKARGEARGEAREEAREKAREKVDLHATQRGLPPVTSLDDASASLTGSLQDENLPQILQFLNANTMTGELKVVGRKLDGHIAFDKGVAFFGDAGKYKGVFAIYALARQTEGRFWFKKTPDPPAHAANIQEPMVRIIFECCKRLDEAEHAGME